MRKTPRKPDRVICGKGTEANIWTTFKIMQFVSVCERVEEGKREKGISFIYVYNNASE